MRMGIAAVALAVLFNSAGAACEPPALKQEMLIGLLVCKAAGAYDGLKPSHDKALLALIAAPGGAGTGGQDGMVFCARAAAQLLVAQNQCRPVEPARTVQRPSPIALASRQSLAAARQRRDVAFADEGSLR